MCKANFRIGYNPCVREEAIDLLMAGHKRGAVAKKFSITWPTVRNWLTEYKLAEKEIELHLKHHSP